jgi:mitogen-activated protein kinase kinase
MLLQHGWLAELSKPHTISEEDEDAEIEDATGGHFGKSGTEDEEVADWVKNAIERKKKGLMGEVKKPALHAAPLDTVSPAANPG